MLNTLDLRCNLTLITKLGVIQRSAFGVLRNTPTLYLDVKSTIYDILCRLTTAFILIQQALVCLTTMLNIGLSYFQVQVFTEPISMNFFLVINDRTRDKITFLLKVLFHLNHIHNHLRLLDHQIPSQRETKIQFKATAVKL